MTFLKQISISGNDGTDKPEKGVSAWSSCQFFNKADITIQLQYIYSLWVCSAVTTLLKRKSL